MDDYFYERNKEIGERLLKGESPLKLASEFGIENVSIVEACFPLDVSYQSLKLIVRKRFSMGEAIPEIARTLNVNGALIKAILGMGTAKAKRVVAICKMFDTGYSKTKISKVTKLPIKVIDKVISKMGRNISQMPYYGAWNIRFPNNDSENWMKGVFEYLIEDTIEGYKLSIRNQIEKEFQEKSRKEFNRFIRNELDEVARIDDDYKYAEKVLRILSKSKKSSQKEITTQAIIEYGRKLGLKRGGGSFGDKDAVKARILHERELDEVATTIDEIGELPLDMVQNMMLMRYNKENRNAEIEHLNFLPDYLKE